VAKLDGIAAPPSGWDRRRACLYINYIRLTHSVLQGEVPIAGDVLGGTLTGLPVAVRGDIRDPTVVPLDPRVVASGLTALFTRALRIPERMLAPMRSTAVSAEPAVK
jgi:hypothetical protein